MIMSSREGVGPECVLLPPVQIQGCRSLLSLFCHSSSFLPEDSQFCSTEITELGCAVVTHLLYPTSHVAFSK